MADLLTLSEYKALVGIQATDTRKDAQINALIPAVSRAIRSYVDRQIDIAGTPGPRTFQYDYSGFLDVDDFTNLTAVSASLGTPPETYTLDPNEYTAMPHREEATDNPHYYIVIHALRLPGSPEMGFERNLDKLEVLPLLPTITVTATWGWASIPQDIKLAAAWTIQESIEAPQGPQAEAIEGWSRSFGQAGASRILAIPNRARDLLANYQRAYG